MSNQLIRKPTHICTFVMLSILKLSLLLKIGYNSKNIKIHFSFNYYGNNSLQ